MHVRGYINKKSAERVSNKHTGNPDTENGIKLYGQFPNWKWTLTSRPIRMLMIMIPPTFSIGFHF